MGARVQSPPPTPCPQRQDPRGTPRRTPDLGSACCPKISLTNTTGPEPAAAATALAAPPPLRSAAPAGLGERVLYARCGLSPIRMNAVAEQEVRAIVAEAGGHVLAGRPDDHGPEMASRLYFVTRPPQPTRTF